jgi:hypothetical protein
MAVFNNNMSIGHGSHVRENATDFKLSLNGVSVSANSKQVVFSSGGKKKTLVMDESVLIEPKPGKPGGGEEGDDNKQTFSLRDSKQGITSGIMKAEKCVTMRNAKIGTVGDALESGVGIEMYKDGIFVMGKTCVKGGLLLDNLYLADVVGENVRVRMGEDAIQLQKIVGEEEYNARIPLTWVRGDIV